MQKWEWIKNNKPITLGMVDAHYPPQTIKVSHTQGEILVSCNILLIFKRPKGE